MKKIITSSCGKYNTTLEIEIKIHEINSNIIQIEAFADVYGQKINHCSVFSLEKSEKCIEFVKEIEEDVRKRLDFLIEKQSLQRRDEIIKSLSKLNYV